MEKEGISWMQGIPNDWGRKRLKDLIEKLESGVSVNATGIPAQSGQYGVLKTSCVNEFRFNPNENKTIWKEEIERAKSNPKKGNIIISRMNTPELVGASGFIENDYPTLFLPDRLWQTIFYPNVKLNSKWLSYLLMAVRLREVISFSATGTSPSMKNLPQDVFLGLEIPFPRLSEQNAIVNYLDSNIEKIDRKINLLKQKASLYDKLKQSLIDETVTKGLEKNVVLKDSEIPWVGEVPEHWKKMRVKDLFVESKRKSVTGEETLLSVSEYSGVTRKIDNVDKDALLTTAATLVGYKICNVNDLVINIMLAWKRGLGVSPYDGIVSPSYAVYTPGKSVCPAYFHYLFRSEKAIAEFKRSSTGIIESRLRLYTDSFYSIEVAIPEYEEQKAIADYLNAKTAMINQIGESISIQIGRLKELRKTLINDVVTGEIRIVEGEEGATELYERNLYAR